MLAGLQKKDEQALAACIRQYGAYAASVVRAAGPGLSAQDVEEAAAEAERRLETVAAPANVQRFQSKTPCLATGRCMHCKSPGRICCTYVVHRFCRTPGRIKVILVGEALGF